MGVSLIDAIQQRVAVIAIGPSTARGQGVAGVVSAGQAFLSALLLSRFATNNCTQYRSELDKATDNLKLAFPDGAQSWGLARKCLNIFLRDAFYTHYLREHYHLGCSENWYEIPLDGIIAKALRKASPKIPRWLGIKYLTPDVSDLYQQAASELAERRGISRVHLDTYLWIEGR